MQIIRVEGNTRKSRVDGVEVDGLPKGLRMRMVKLLNKLAGVKRINVKDKAQGALFELSDKNVTLSFFDRKIKQEFLNTIELLGWFLGRHWSSFSPPGAIGGTIYCTECTYSTVPGAVGEYCPVPDCPSHKKWRMIIGPSYEPPEGFIGYYKKRPLLRDNG